MKAELPLSLTVFHTIHAMHTVDTVSVVCVKTIIDKYIKSFRLVPL